MAIGGGGGGGRLLIQLDILKKNFCNKTSQNKTQRLCGGECSEIVARLGNASILSNCLHEIYRYYEILGEEQYELHTRWLWRRLWKGIISLSSIQVNQLHF